MRFDLINRLHFYKLREGSDRRGPIVTAFLKDIPNSEYAENQGYEILKSVISLLSSTYGHRPEQFFGEQDECWVNLDWQRQNGGAGAITVHHKYWYDHTIDTFRNVLVILAKRHEWEVTTDDGDFWSRHPESVLRRCL